MKRLISLMIFCVLTFSGAQNLFAGDYGIVAGAGFTGMKDVGKGLATGYHAGFTYKAHLPLGFAVQPSLLYHLKRSAIDSASEGNVCLDYRMGYVELPVSFQWGPDLLLFRPFLDVSPYVGYGLSNRMHGCVSFKNNWEGVNRFEYGLGLGAGLEIWKIQLVCRYNWNFGPLCNGGCSARDTEDSWSKARESVLQGKNFSGVTLSVAILF